MDNSEYLKTIETMGEMAGTLLELLTLTEDEFKAWCENIIRFLKSFPREIFENLNRYESGQCDIANLQKLQEKGVEFLREEQDTYINNSSSCGDINMETLGEMSLRLLCRT